MLLLLSGPAGVGKSTIGDRLVSHHGFVRSVSATTRPPRGSEQHGVDYHFLTRAEFESGLASGHFLEHAEVHGQLYGTPRAPIESWLKAGESVLLIIDVDGARQVRAMGLPNVSVFILPPSRDALLERMRARGTEDEAKIAKRMERVDREIAAAGEYDFQIVNRDLEPCIVAVADAVSAARKRMGQG